MAYAKDIMLGGVSPNSARAYQGQVQTGISAAGTTISDATALKQSISMLSTVAANAGVQIADGDIGDSCEIFNGGANPCKVYPPTGDSFNSLSVNASFSLGTNTMCYCRKISASQWIVNLSA